MKIHHGSDWSDLVVFTPRTTTTTTAAMSHWLFLIYQFSYWSWWCFDWKIEIDLARSRHSTRKIGIVYPTNTHKHTHKITCILAIGKNPSIDSTLKCVIFVTFCSMPFFWISFLIAIWWWILPASQPATTTTIATDCFDFRIDIFDKASNNTVLFIRFTRLWFDTFLTCFSSVTIVRTCVFVDWIWLLPFQLFGKTSIVHRGKYKKKTARKKNRLFLTLSIFRCCHNSSYGCCVRCNQIF